MELEKLSSPCLMWREGEVPWTNQNKIKKGGSDLPGESLLVTGPNNCLVMDDD